MKRSIGAFAIGLSLVAFSGSIAVAQDADSADEAISIPEAFEREFFDESGTSFEADQFPRNITVFIGPNFAEEAIRSDAEDVHELYTELLEQQISSTPLVRTPDLENPYDTSLRTSPNLGIEEEPIPPAEPIPVFPPVQSAPPAPVRPVPALW